MNISKYIGIPFKDKGRSEQGVDCWGLVRLVYQRELNIELPSLTDQYSSAEDVKEVAELILLERESWQRIPRGREKEGDVVLLRLLGLLTHVGLVLGERKMLHVMRDIETSIEDYTRFIWARRTEGFYRYVS